MRVLEACDNPVVKYNSSISQHSNTLCVLIRGEWCPISFDVLDYIDCEEAKSHRAIVTDGDDIGFNFPVGECCLVNNEYVYHDGDRKELRTLPEWFGAGMYEAYIKKDTFTNFDNTALGTTQEYRLRIGLNYALADRTLPSVE